jgi:hypothetical protein
LCTGILYGFGMMSTCIRGIRFTIARIKAVKEGIET